VTFCADAKRRSAMLGSEYSKLRRSLFERTASGVIQPWRGLWFKSVSHDSEELMTQRGNGITRAARRAMLRTVRAGSEAEVAADGDEAATDAAAWRTGHCRPPIAYSFKPGQSGNPAGRPRRGATGAPGDRLPGAHEPTKAMILEEAYRLVTMRIGEEEQMALSLASAIGPCCRSPIATPISGLLLPAC
jgi:hypothetical protein